MRYDCGINLIRSKEIPGSSLFVCQKLLVATESEPLVGILFFKKSPLTESYGHRSVRESEFWVTSPDIKTIESLH